MYARMCVRVSVIWGITRRKSRVWIGRKGKFNLFRNTPTFTFHFLQYCIKYFFFSSSKGYMEPCILI